MFPFYERTSSRRPLRPSVRRYAYSSKAIVLVRRITMAVDPVCKMDVDEKTAQFKSTFEGKEYFFCALGCKRAFDKNPKKFV